MFPPEPIAHRVCYCFAFSPTGINFASQVSGEAPNFGAPSPLKDILRREAAAASPPPPPLQGGRVGRGAKTEEGLLLPGGWAGLGGQAARLEPKWIQVLLLFLFFLLFLLL